MKSVSLLLSTLLQSQFHQCHLQFWEALLFQNSIASRVLSVIPFLWRCSHFFGGTCSKQICQISKVCSFGFLYEYRKECIKTLSCFGVIRGGHHIQNSKYSFSPRDIGTLTDIIRWKTYFADLRVKCIRNCSSWCNRKKNVRW